jgi:outer membrane immunogenic protein
MGIRGIAALALLVAGAAAPGIALAGPAPAYNWTGGYIGAFGGYGWGTVSTGTTRMYEDADGLDESTYSPIAPFSYPSSGFIGGVEVGSNWQTGGLVYGIAADIAAAHIRGSYADDDAGFATDSTINWLGTARLVVGFPTGNMLFYGTGGLAVGGVTAGLHDTYGSDVVDSSASGTNVGWTIGGGVAAAVNTNWIVKAEYLYVDLGSKNYSFSEGSPGFPLITTSAQTKASIAKFSVGFKY